MSTRVGDITEYRHRCVAIAELCCGVSHLSYYAAHPVSNWRDAPRALHWLARAGGRLLYLSCRGRFKRQGGIGR
jgi:hypothetical protein